jgi:hypothetical protein
MNEDCSHVTFTAAAAVRSNSHNVRARMGISFVMLSLPRFNQPERVYIPINRYTVPVSSGPVRAFITHFGVLQ